MRLRVRATADNSATALSIDNLMRIIQTKTDRVVTANNWVSKLPLIADDFEVSLPSAEDVDFQIQRVTEEITLNRRCYTKTDSSVYKRRELLKSLRNQI